MAWIHYHHENQQPVTLSFFYFAVAISDLIYLAEELRTHTIHTMKMEPAPWIRDYVKNMDDLYTELTLEKIDDKLFEEERKKLESYKELFASGLFEYMYIRYYIPEYLDIRYYIPSLKPKRKILIKGDPGMGKTSLVKKIAYDWAKGDFDEISIVFFVFLKVVKPGDLIENVIMLQNPMSEGLNVTGAALGNILARFGPECLLILDGLDECALGQNSEVRKIITGAKFKTCNVILTSRPHSTREFESCFDTIVSVEGFTRSEAKKFASRIVDDAEKVERVLKFNPTGERADRSVHNVPILLSFLCLLVREDNVDLSDKTISMGEIYFRMVRCLYKKYCIRNLIEFNTASFIQAMTLLGKVALDMLLSDNALLQREQIIAEVGSDVFDYGLLIGHEDAHKLIQDETADIFVTFPHRSILEFLGAYYFVLSLGKKQTVKYFDKAVTKSLMNRLFSQFCVWFLDESNELCPFLERSVASDWLSRAAAEHIDATTINFIQVGNNFQVLDLALKDHNISALGMLEKTLKGCFGAKHLVISSRHPVELILTSLNDNVFESFKSIKIRDNERLDRTPVLIPVESPLLFLHSSTHNIKVVVEKALDTLLSKCVVSIITICAARNRPVSVELAGGDLHQLLLRERPSELHTLVLKHCERTLKTLENITQANVENKLLNLCFLSISCSLVSGRLHMLLKETFPALTTLILSDCGLKAPDLTILAVAVEQMLPSLCVLDISGTSVEGCLHLLLTGIFPSLTTLILSYCGLRIGDLTELAEASMEGKLPELRHLDISWNYSLRDLLQPLKYVSDKLFFAAFPKLITLIARGCGLDANSLQSLSETGRLQHLMALDLSRNPYISGHVFVLLYQPLLSLNILILRGYALTSDDMRTLAYANVLNRLPQLMLLDISLNPIGYKSGCSGLAELLSHQFPSLAYLILCDCLLSEKDLDSLAEAKLADKLPAVKYIDVSFNGLTRHLDRLTRNRRTGCEAFWIKIICFEKFLDSRSTTKQDLF